MCCPTANFCLPLELSGVEKYFQGLSCQKLYGPSRYLWPLRTSNRTANKYILIRVVASARTEHSASVVVRLEVISPLIQRTIPWAIKTGNMTLRPFSVVHSIIYDEKKGKATGVRVIDAQTKN